MHEPASEPPEALPGRAVLPREEIRVSKRTNVGDLAAAIWQCHKRGRLPTLVAIGLEAINQAMKSVTAANAKGACHGVVYTVLPALEEVTITDDAGNSVERTLMKLVLVPYQW